MPNRENNASRAGNILKHVAKLVITTRLLAHQRSEFYIRQLNKTLPFKESL